MPTHDTDRHVLDLAHVDRSQVPLVGGKGAHLGELARIEGVRVPAAFCVTTEAYRRIVLGTPSIADRIERLAALGPHERDALGRISAELRRTIEEVEVPADVADAIAATVARLGDGAPWAVRSSATVEDLPTTSSAGQHDSHLGVAGAEDVVRHVARCWASLFTDRAVAHRTTAGVDHRQVAMAVVVQRMVEPDAAGVMFTADPVTSNRLVVCVEATFGLGEPLVSGRVDPDVVRVRAGRVVDRVVGAKQVALRPAPGGGTREEEVDPARRSQPVLTDAQVLDLAALGRRIEAHLGEPQDVEWCLVGDDVHVVQSRPITTLFPIPERDDDEPHVYVSVGHQQMMTDPMTPLGLSVWQLTALAPMHVAGGRLFVDVTARLASPADRDALLDLMGRSDPLVRDALRSILDDRDLVTSLPEDTPAGPPPVGPPSTIPTDPAIVADLVARARASLAALEREIVTCSGPAVFDLIVEDVPEMRRVMSDPQSMQALMAGMEARWWLDDRLHEWLGEKGAADLLSLSAPGNVTAEMGLALLDVADAVRPHPEVVAFLREVDDDDLLEDGRLAALDGGRAARDAIRAYLDRYGVRCVGEIDISRPRWSERPTTLLPAILRNVDAFEPGEARRRFERGERLAAEKAQEVLARLRELPDGRRKAEEAAQVIDRLRTFVGYREHPKYAMVSRYAAYRRALLREVDGLVAAGVLGGRDDASFLTFHELHEAVRTHRVDDALVRRRRAAFASYRSLSPPRVLTSEGEAVVGSHRRADLPLGALAGMPVSGGVVEGRARVVLDMAEADVEEGDILVTAYTDPSWSPLFVAVAGLVTEVGGLMTHGAVVAREYGLPTVVGVPGATQAIRDGQRIRLDASAGVIELLDPV